MDKISLIGLGYIGLPTAAMFAAHGKSVIGVDVDPHVVNETNAGRSHIVEPGLDEMVSRVVGAGFLTAQAEPESADAFLITVPTPFRGDSHEPDITYVEAACRAIAPVLCEGNLIVLESTSPVGTTLWMCGLLASLRPDLRFPHEDAESSDIAVAYCPERILPGRALNELVANDRVIGGVTVKCSQKAKALYECFVNGDCVTSSSPAEAEMTKLAENAFRDVNIAYANELSILAEDLGVNVWEVISLANRHPRVNILQPGPGVGGHCIAVDPWFLVSSNPQATPLITTSRLVNDSKPQWVASKILRALDGLEVREIILFGLAFKPNVDDFRGSPALEVATLVMANAPTVRIYVVEPYIAAEKLEAILPGATLIGVRDALLKKWPSFMLVNHDLFADEGCSKLSGFESFCCDRFPQA